MEAEPAAIAMASSPTTTLTERRTPVGWLVPTEGFTTPPSRGGRMADISLGGESWIAASIFCVRTEAGDGTEKASRRDESRKLIGEAIVEGRGRVASFVAELFADFIKGLSSLPAALDAPEKSGLARRRLASIGVSPVDKWGRRTSSRGRGAFCDGGVGVISRERQRGGDAGGMGVVSIGTLAGCRNSGEARGWWAHAPASVAAIARHALGPLPSSTSPRARTARTALSQLSCTALLEEHETCSRESDKRSVCRRREGLPHSRKTSSQQAATQPCEAHEKSRGHLKGKSGERCERVLRMSREAEVMVDLAVPR